MCSITMQSLGKIVQRASAVVAKIWCLYICFFTGRMPRSGDSRYLNLLTGRKSAFLPQGRFVAPIHVKSGTAKGHIGPVGRAKFHANRPQNGKNFHFLVETRLERANPLTDLYNY